MMHGCEVTCHRLQAEVGAVCERSHTAVADSVDQSLETTASVRPEGYLPNVRPTPSIVGTDIV